jgi:hypothetical protein
MCLVLDSIIYVCEQSLGMVARDLGLPTPHQYLHLFEWAYEAQKLSILNSETLTLV